MMQWCSPQNLKCGKDQNSLGLKTSLDLDEKVFRTSVQSEITALECKSMFSLHTEHPAKLILTGKFKVKVQ